MSEEQRLKTALARLRSLYRRVTNAADRNALKVGIEHVEARLVDMTSRDKDDANI